MRFRKLRIAWSVVCGVACLLLSLFCVQSWSWRSPEPTRSRTFGDEQLLQLLNDRPTMNGILDPHDYIYEWAIQQFNSSRPENRICWDHLEPISGRPAESVRAYDTHPAVIRLTSSTATSARDKWLMLVYEFHNLRSAKDFENLDRLAARGDIDRNRYSEKYVALEFKATVQTKRFFAIHPIRGATAKSDPFYVGYMASSDNLHDYIRRLRSNSADEYNPLDYFGRAFDKLQPTSNGTWLEWLKSL
jgi:hypothetical protein